MDYIDTGTGILLHSNPNFWGSVWEDLFLGIYFQQFGLFEIQNEFLMTNYDVPDRLDMFYTFSMPLGHKNRFFIAWFFDKMLIRKALKTSKSEIFVEKFGNEKSIFTTQRRQDCLKHVPIGPEHHN